MALPRLASALALAVVAGAALAQGLPARAGSATADSIWDRKNALQRAMQGMPAGATLTKESCETIEVGLDNIRHRCTVWWSDPPTTAPTTARAP